MQVQFALHDIQQVHPNIKKACVPSIYRHWTFRSDLPPLHQRIHFAYKVDAHLHYITNESETGVYAAVMRGLPQATFEGKYARSKQFTSLHTEFRFRSGEQVVSVHQLQIPLLLLQTEDGVVVSPRCVLYLLFINWWDRKRHIRNVAFVTQDILMELTRNLSESSLFVQL
jgi:hypothetical protein